MEMEMGVEKHDHGNEHSLDDLLKAKSYLMRYYVEQLKKLK